MVDLTNTPLGNIYRGMVPGVLIGLGMMFGLVLFARRDNLPVMETISRWPNS